MTSTVTHVLIVEPDSVLAQRYANNIGLMHEGAIVQRISDTTKAKLLLEKNPNITHVSVGSQLKNRADFLRVLSPIQSNTL